MLCDVCKSNTATVYLTQIVDGKMQKVNLCETCSKEKGVTDPTSFAFLDLLQGLGTAQMIEKSQSTVRCGVCGFSHADFKKTGRLGCSACYETFEEQLSPLLKSIHHASTHVGKTPARAVKVKRFAAQMQVLEQDLHRAVTEENYETAANIRDQIKKLKSEQTDS
jgi:protein arginine kinase activator